jgi:hypothetical protein
LPVWATEEEVTWAMKQWCWALALVILLTALLPDIEA